MSLFQKIYSRINWINRPSASTPLGATNLNKMDYAIDTIDSRIVSLDTAKLDLSVGNQMVKSVLFDDKTGVFSVVLLDGTITTYNTAVEKIAINFRYDKDTQSLILTLADGSTQSIDMSALVTQYEFADSGTIGFQVSTDGKVSAIVKNGSITSDKLEPDYLAKINVQASEAQASAESAAMSATDADYDAKLAQSYAISGSGIREGEDTDNAKYYKEQAEKALSEMQAGSVTGVKGDNETEYRRGNVNIKPQDIGALAAYGDTKNNIVTYTSFDSDKDLVWSDVPIMKTGEEHSILFGKISTMLKNMRYLYKILGVTDISHFADGTVSGAINDINSKLKPIRISPFTNSENFSTHNAAIFFVEKIKQVIFSIEGNYSNGAIFLGTISENYRPLIKIPLVTSEGGAYIGTDGKIILNNSPSTNGFIVVSGVWTLF